MIFGGRLSVRTTLCLCALAYGGWSDAVSGMSVILILCLTLPK